MAKELKYGSEARKALEAGVDLSLIHIQMCIRDRLKVRDNLTGHAAKLDLKNILENPFASSKDKVIFDPKKVYDFELQKTADEKVLLKQMKTALEQKQKRSIEINVSNINRSFGTIFGSEITRRYKDTLEDDTYVVKCNGAGGQSLSLIHILRPLRSFVRN